MRILLVEPEYRTAVHKKVSEAKISREENISILAEREQANLKVAKADEHLRELKAASLVNEQKRSKMRKELTKKCSKEYKFSIGKEAKSRATQKRKKVTLELKMQNQHELEKEKAGISQAQVELTNAKKNRFEAYRRRIKKFDDERLWYPPIGLLKLARYHMDRGDEVQFVRGCDKTVFHEGDLFRSPNLWDRVYITSLFTYHFKTVTKTVNFYKEAVGGTISKIFIGGIMASLMPRELHEETDVYPVEGVLTSSESIGFKDDVNIDQLPPAYELLDENLYAINDTYYAYTTRGCRNSCPWCGVPAIEPNFREYIDIKPQIRKLRQQYGDKPVLRLMDNNVLASKKLTRIVKDLETLGYGRGQFTKTVPQKERVIDFNQGLDASFIRPDTIRLVAKLNIKPFRIAFDKVSEEKKYVRAVKLAFKNGFTELSNYLLFNFKDKPKDLYRRLCINIDLNEEYRTSKSEKVTVYGSIYSYPMRYAPISEDGKHNGNRERDVFLDLDTESIDWLTNPLWTPRFVRNIEIMKGAAHGAISPTPGLARRAIGSSFKEFIANLYMPEEMLRNRNVHEKKVYKHEPKRKPGTGKVEEFREFILRLLKRRDNRFLFFHKAVTPNTTASIRNHLGECKDKEIRKWLKYYLEKR
ncbi:hypothetical protein ACFL5V_00485 [Fibrobacterota bacterium]